MTARVFRRSASPNPPVAVEAHGSTIVDSEGREYLDAAGGAIVVNVGHGRREIADAIAEQAARLSYAHGSAFTTEALERYAAELGPHLPVDDPAIYPVSGGSEAIETALKLARATQLARGDADRWIVFARWGSYHGNTLGALDLSGRRPLRRPYEGWLGRFRHVSAAYPYRGGDSGSQALATTQELVDELDRAISSAEPGTVCAFVGEPIVGATLAAVEPPEGYWQGIADVCRHHGVLLIADEVMTGFGRTGTWFGMDHSGVRPDLLVAAKGATSGYWPFGFVAASGEVYDAVTGGGGFVHGFTYSHQPVAATVAREVLRILEAESLVEASATKGERLRALVTRAMLVPLLTIAAVAVALAYVQALQGLLATLAFSALAAILSRAFQRWLLGRGLGRGLALTLTVVAFILILVLLGAAAVASMLAIAVQLSGDTESLARAAGGRVRGLRGGDRAADGIGPVDRRRRAHRRSPPAAVDGRPGRHGPVHGGPDRHLPAARRRPPAGPDARHTPAGSVARYDALAEGARRLHQGPGDARRGRRGRRHGPAARPRRPVRGPVGRLSFLFTFVPNIGFILALVPPDRVRASSSSGSGRPSSSWAATSSINLAFDYVLQPRIMATDLDISPVVVDRRDPRLDRVHRPGRRAARGAADDRAAGVLVPFAGAHWFVALLGPVPGEAGGDPSLDPTIAAVPDPVAADLPS